MNRILLALRILFDGQLAARVRTVIEEEPGAAKQSEPPAAIPPPPSVPDAALSVLAALQREARFLDFIKEPIDTYSDAQIGAAVRDVHRSCAEVIERMFGVRPLLDSVEGAEIEVPDGFDAFRYRLTGQVTGAAPYRGRVMHHGWEAARCEIPQQTTAQDARRVLAPAEVEVA